MLTQGVSRPSQFEPFSRPSRRALAATHFVIALLLAGVFAWDLVTPLGEVPWLLYAPILLLTLLLPYRWDTVLLGGLCTLLILVDLVLSPPGGAPTVAIFNRSVGMVLIWATAVGCLLYKRKHQSLRAHQVLIEQFVAHTPAAVAMLDREMRYVLVSERWLQDYKLPETIVGQSHYDVFPDLPERWKEVHRRCLKGAVERCEEDSFIRHGTVEWVRWEVQPWWTAAGEIGGLIIFSETITERKRTEEALRTSEHRLRAVLDNSPNPIFLKDLDGRYLMVNRHFERALSLSREDILGKTDAEVFPAQQAAAFRANDRQVLEAGGPLVFEEEALHHDGLHTSIVHKFPVCDEKGIPYAVGGIVTDITERNRVTAILQRKEALLSTVIQVHPECVKLMSADGSLIMMNEAGLRMIEADSMEQVAGHCVYPLVVEEHRWQFQEMTERVFRGESGALEFEIVGLKGTRRWLETRMAPLRDERGRITTSVGVTRDITERKRAEEQLRSASEYNEQIIAGAQEGIIVYDRQLRYVVWNPFMQELTGLPPEVVLGRRGIDIFPFLREQGIDALQKRALAGESVGPVDTYFTIPGIEKSGWASTRYGPLRDARGQVIGVIGTVRDITLQRNAQEELQQTTERLRALTTHLQSVREEERARIARELHDELAQTLTGLKLSMSWLAGRVAVRPHGKTSEPLIERTNEMSAQIDECIHGIRQLVAELRPPVLDHLDLVGALDWLVRDFKKRTGVACTFHCSSPNISLDSTRTTALFRIAQEALTNVSRHAQANHATVALEDGYSHVHLSVEDDGKGIAESETCRPTAFGILGMKERVTLLGGDISLVGRPGKGTIITVRIPQQPGAARGE